MWGRGRALLRALGALALLLALVVGVPLLLIITVGNPFPAEIPTVDEVRITLTQNGQGFSNFIIGALAVIVWFIWLQLVVALGFEVAATIRRRETRRLPTAPGIQMLAARLVASFTLATTLATAPVLVPAVGALDLGDFEPVAAVVVPDSVAVDDAPSWTQQRAAAAVDWTTDDGTPDQGDARSASVLIVADDTESWDIAEAAYGDGAAWKTIVAANQHTRDATGHAITLDTEVVPAGTSLALPGTIDLDGITALGEVTLATPSASQHVDHPESEAIDAPESATASAESTSSDDVDDGLVETNPATETHVIEPGDSMWSVAEQRVEADLGRNATDAEVADYWVDVVDANRDVPSGSVDLIYPGDQLVVPAAAASSEQQPTDDADGQVTAEAAEAAPTDHTAASLDQLPPDGPVELSTATPSVRAVASAGASVAGATGSVTAPAPANAQAEATDADPGPELGAPLALAGFGSALFAAGILGALRRRRAAQQRQRVPGTVVEPPSSEAAAFEAALSHASSEVIESAHGHGWRLMPATAVAAVTAAGPTAFRSNPDGALVAVSLHDRDEPMPTFRLDSDAPEPASADAVALQLDIDPTAIDAEPEAAVAPTAVVIGTDPHTGEAVLLDLASATLVDVRGDDASVRQFLRSVVLDLAVSDRADDLCVIAVDIAGELADLERVRSVDTLSNALIAAVRCGHATDDSTTPVVVVSSTHAEHDEAVTALVDLGAAVVAPGLADAATRITITGSHARMWPGGSTVQLAALDSEHYRAVAELVDVTSSAAVETAPVVRSVEHVLDVVVDDACGVEAGPVEVKVLGPVSIDGAGSFSSVKAVDVVTYLAFHRHGVDADQIKTWVWPPFEPPTDKAFANVMSRARTALGTDDDGNPYLSRAGADRTYRLAEAVTTDFDRFRAHVERADAATDPQTELGALKAALALVRGVPFTGGTVSSFAWADNHVRSHVEFVIDEAVHRCADLALAIDDLETAREATFTGLDIVPGCEQCFRRRFLVAGADNNRTELRRAMADLERMAAAELGEPEAVDAISADLLALYDELDRGLMAGSS